MFPAETVVAAPGAATVAVAAAAVAVAVIVARKPQAKASKLRQKTRKLPAKQSPATSPSPLLKATLPRRRRTTSHSG